MAPVRHLEFVKFRVYVMRPLSPCCSASSCKVSLKSVNRWPSYGQKWFSRWRMSTILNF